MDNKLSTKHSDSAYTELPFQKEHGGSMVTKIGAACVNAREFGLLNKE